MEASERYGLQQIITDYSRWIKEKSVFVVKYSNKLLYGRPQNVVFYTWTVETPLMFDSMCCLFPNLGIYRQNALFTVYSNLTAPVFPGTHPIISQI
jgi:hypothetical protein